MIYLLRHGLDNEKYVGGWSDGKLTKKGIKQVKSATNYIEKIDFKIECIYTSDVKRAIQTANIVNSKLNVNIIENSIFRELDKGLLTGMKVDVAKRIYPEYFYNLDINTKYPNGESMMELYQRIKRNIDFILSLDNSLIVTHRGVINMLYYILNEINLDMDKEKFNVTHASLHQIDVNRKIKKIY